MKRDAKLLISCLATILVIALVPVGESVAQEPESAAERAMTDATPEQVGQQAAEVLGRLESILTEFRGYKDRLTMASGEDSLVLRIQIADVEDRFMEALRDLARVVVSPDGDETSRELRDRAEIVFTGTTQAIWELIGELRTEIDVLRAQRTATAPADRSELEDRIILLAVRLDRIFKYGGEHLGNLEALGQDTAGPRGIFSDLLAARADELSGRLRLATLRSGELNTRLKETPGDADVTALLVANSKNLQANTASQAAMLDIMDSLELDTRVYRTQLVTTTQDLASGLLNAHVTVTLLSRGWNSFKTWLFEQGPTLLVKILLFLTILFVGRLLARLVRRAVDHSMHRANLRISQLLHRMIVNAAHNAVLGLALLIALSQLGFSLAPLLAGLGVVGFILGFAMQDSLSNLAAGMMILINRPYDVGDMVEISGVFGKVQHMSMVSTSVLTIDNQKLVVPNSKIWGDVIKNVTDQAIRRVDLVFGISYSDDIPHAEQVLEEILAGHELVLDDPEPVVRLHNLNDSSMDFVVRPWVKTDDYWNVHWDVTRAVKMRFDAEGISIPFPQQDVHLHTAQSGASTTDDTNYPEVVARDPDEIAGDEG